MRPSTLSVWMIALVMLCAVGCKTSPQQQKSLAAIEAKSNQQLASLQKLEQRVGQLGSNNVDLHTQLAQARQQTQVYADEAKLLRARLQTTTNALDEAVAANQIAQQRITTMTASTQARGGVSIRANNGFSSQLKKVEVPGTTVIEEDGAIRIRIPGDRLFLAHSATLHRDAYPLLEQVIDAVNRQYPDQKMDVETHTDGAQMYGSQWTNRHQLTAAQASALFTQLTTRYRISETRLRLVSQGSNKPVASNRTPEGQAANRRVELVIQP